MDDPRVYTLSNSRGDVVLTASTRELDPDHEYWLTREPDSIFGGSTMRGDDFEADTGGDYTSHRTPSAKSHELKLRIHLPSHSACMLERMRLGAALADGEPGELVMSGGGLPRMRMGVERTGAVLTSHVAPTTFDFSVVLKQPRPWMYGDEQSVTVLPVGAGVGLVYPLYAPDGVISYGAESGESTGVLSNGGTVPAWPVHTAMGNLPTGFRVYQGSNVIEWNGAAVNVPVVVSTAASSVSINGTDITHFVSRDGFAAVPAGGSTLIRFEPLGGGTGYLTSALAPTYI